MSDTPKASKSLYDASLGDIAVKHFFAGFMQGLGGLVVTMISWVLIYVLIINIVLPQISGMLGQAEGLMKSLEKIQNPSGSTNLMNPSTGTRSGQQEGTVTIPAELLKQVQQSMQAQ
jgi:hypothetical protein